MKKIKLCNNNKYFIIDNKYKWYLHNSKVVRYLNHI